MNAMLASLQKCNECQYIIVLQTVRLELTGRTAKRRVDIARTGSPVTSSMETVQTAVKRGTRQVFAKHSYVSGLLTFSVLLMIHANIQPCAKLS